MTQDRSFAARQDTARIGAVGLRVGLNFRHLRKQMRALVGVHRIKSGAGGVKALGCHIIGENDLMTGQQHVDIDHFAHRVIDQNVVIVYQIARRHQHLVGVE